MAIDPFSQQIIQYYDCSVLILGTISTIPITNFYSAGSTYENGGGSVPDGSMTAALYLGLLNPPTNASSSITFDCPTGNCTFAASDGASYSSLAMCSRCSDISHTIHNASTMEQGSNYTLPSGCVIGSGGVVLSSMVIDLPDAPPDLMPADIFSFESLMFGPAAAPLAIRCSLFPCVNTYGGNITNGILQEQRISSDPLLLVDAGQGSYFSLITNKSVENGEWYDCNPTEHATDENTIPISAFITPYNFSMGVDAPKGYYRRSCVWTLAPPPSMGLMGALGFLFNKQSVSNIDDIPGGDQWMVNLYDNGSASLERFEKTMEGLVNSITTTIRQQGDNSTSGLASGTMSGLQTCIRVQWLWLALPASLLLLTVVFLVATMMRMSFRYVRHIWKSSALALLFHGFSTDTLQKYGPVGSSDTEEKARQMRAQLRFADGEWRFVRSDD